MNREDYEKALLNPADAFADPEDVVAHDGLTREQKVEILERWQHDADETAVAQSEGMEGGDTTERRKIAKALEAV